MIDQNETLDLENATIKGGTLDGNGTIATAAGNIDSTLNGVTIDSNTLVTAVVGTLELTGIITNNGEIDATTGTLDFVDAIVNGGALGGPGTIGTATGNTDSTLSGVTILSGVKVTASVGTLDLTGIITNNGEIDATDRHAGPEERHHQRRHDQCLRRDGFDRHQLHHRCGDRQLRQH